MVFILLFVYCLFCHSFSIILFRIFREYCPKMKIVIDVRETSIHDKLVSLLPPTPPVELLLKPLHLGDITIENDKGETLVLFERKSLFDLLASIKDGRYTEQSHRLIHTSNMPPHNIVYIVEGMYSQLKNPADKQVCISALTTMFYFKGFSVFRTCSVLETAELIFGMAKKIQKELLTGKTPHFVTKVPETVESVSTNIVEDNPSPDTLDMTETRTSEKSYCEVVHKIKKENITPENIGEIILCSIPGISSTSAIEIMKHYSSFANFMEEIESRPEKLNAIYLTTNGKKRKLGKNIIENIHRFLGKG
jgi:ERCC4-type nuclease